MGKIPISFVGSGGHQLSQGQSANGLTAYPSLPLSLENDGAEIGAMMIAGSVCIRCTNSADEADKGPLASHSTGRKPVFSAWWIDEKVIMDASLATARLAGPYPKRSQSRKHR